MLLIIAASLALWPAWCQAFEPPLPNGFTPGAVKGDKPSLIIPSPGNNRLTLSEVWARAERGEIVDIAVGITATGTQYACDAPLLEANGIRFKAANGVHRVQKIGGVISVSDITPKPMAAPIAQPSCGWVLVNGQWQYRCPNAR